MARRDKKWREERNYRRQARSDETPVSKPMTSGQRHVVVMLFYILFTCSFFGTRVYKDGKLPDDPFVYLIFVGCFAVVLGFTVAAVIKELKASGKWPIRR